jgi:hypothetical protein
LAAEFGGDECRRERQQSASGVCFEAGIRNEALYVWSSARAAVGGTWRGRPVWIPYFLALVEAQFGFPLWHGLRVVAGDATVLRLTLFGKTRDGKPFARHIVDAIGFALYLPGI